MDPHVELNSTSYKGHQYIGKAIVVKNSKFEKKPKAELNQKADKVVETLEKMGFKGVMYRKENDQMSDKAEMKFENVSKEFLKKLLTDAADENLNDYSEMDCFVCVILSYGVPGAIYCPGKLGSGDDDLVELKTLQDPFKPKDDKSKFKDDKCRTLLLKPKIFILQGNPYEETTSRDDGAGKIITQHRTIKIPTEADFLTYSSNCNDTMSWFVDALCKGLQDYCIKEIPEEDKRLDFMSILTRVNQLFVKNVKDAGFEISEKIEIPLVTSMLTKKINLRPKPLI